MQATNLLVSSRRHSLCRVNSSIKTRDTYLPSTPSLTPITQASAASIQNPFALSGTLYVRLSSPSQASPFRLVHSCCVQVSRRRVGRTRSGMSARGSICTEAPRALTRDKGPRESQTPWRDHPQAKWMHAWWYGVRASSRVLPSYLLALPACTMSQYQIRLFWWPCSSFAVLCDMRGSRSIGTTCSAYRSCSRNGHVRLKVDGFSKDLGRWDEG
jgi:hypothetical protein